MDADLSAANAHLRLAEMALAHRLAELEKSKSRMSRHYSRMAHTAALLILVNELQGLVAQDPDEWDEEPELVPF